MYTGACSVQDEVNSYDYKEEERCQEWSPAAINNVDRAAVRRWNRSSGCEKMPSDAKLICLR